MDTFDYNNFQLIIFKEECNARQRIGVKVLTHERQGHEGRV